MPRGMRRRMRDRARRRMRDRAHSRRRDYAMGDYRMYSSPESDYGYDYGDYARGSRSSSRMGSQSNRQRDGHYDYPMSEYEDYARGRRDYNYDMRGRRDYRDYRRDYGEDEEYLPEDELMDWCEDLMAEVEPKDKQFFTKENIKNRAEMMNIKFDEFTPEEFHVTTLMMYTDYKEPLGTTNLDMYLPLAKAWLLDKDSDLQGSEKLAAYYYNVVCADEE